jgi:diadenosine tetraphosphate (Ap4A) HIT family hydrolase
MASIFTRIIAGELPGRFLWQDDRCVVLLDVRPLAVGHALVMPRAEVDRWTDLGAADAAHLMTVAHHVANAQMAVFEPARIALIIAGFEVPHTHLHVVPATSMANLDFSNADTNPDQTVLDDAADRIRAALRAAGHAQVPD